MAKRKNDGDVYTEVKDAAKARVDKLAELESQLAAAEREMKNCESRSARALQSDSAEAYASAKNAERSAADKAEFFKIKIDELKGAPLFSNNEITVIVSRIMDDIERVKAEKLAAGLQDIQRGAATIESFVEYINTANATLKAAHTGRQGGSQVNLFEYTGLRRALSGVLEIPIVKPYLK